MVANTAKHMLQPILLSFIAISLMGCIVSNDSKIHHINGPTMGTWYNVKFQALPKHHDISQIQTIVDKVLADINQKMSTYLDDSELSIFNRAELQKWQPLSRETLQVLRISQQVYKESGGAFDITVGPLVNLWGFGKTDTQDKVPDQSAIDSALVSVGADAIALQQDQASRTRVVSIDLSAVAKGYAADQVAVALESMGIYHYMVEVGGELRMGKRKLNGELWKIAVEEPSEHQRVIKKVLGLESIAVATSGDYRNYFEKDGKRYSHTIDPRTGRPIEHQLASVTVVHKSCAYADAYATAITVLGPEKGLAMAKSLGLAVYMLVKTDTGFDVLQTKSFSSYVDQASI